MSTSSDGVTWMVRNSAGTRTLYAITFNNGRYVVAGFRGALLTSFDLAHWNDRSLDTFDDFHGAASTTNGIFLVVGSSLGALTSLDGLSWTPRPSCIAKFGAVWGEDSFLAVGVGSFIQQSAPLLPLCGRLQPSGFELTVTTELGRAYALEATADFTSWVTLYRHTNTQAMSQFLDVGANRDSAKFYRLTSP